MPASETSPFVRLLTLFGIAATASFAASTLFNGLIFWAAWRINFFMIASTQDVILGGFAIAIRVALFSIAFLVFVFLLGRALNLAAIRLLGWRVSSWWEDYHLAVAVTVIAAVFISLPLSLWPFALSHPPLLSLSRLRVESPMAYQTGLRVAPESNKHAFCHGGEVLWMGSASAVLKCAQGVRVIHGREGLVTELTTDIPSA